MVFICKLMLLTCMVSRNVSEMINLITFMFDDQAHIINCISWMVYRYPRINPSWLTTATLKSLWCHNFVAAGMIRIKSGRPL